MTMYNNRIIAYQKNNCTKKKRSGYGKIGYLLGGTIMNKIALHLLLGWEVEIGLYISFEKLQASINLTHRYEYHVPFQINKNLKF